MSLMTKTKIVATIGPASDSPAMIKKLILAGVNVFRFNLKHNNQQWHNSRIERVENISQQINRPVAIMLDLQGPEIRIGNFEENEIRVKKGEKVIFALQRSKGEKTIVLDNLKLLQSLALNAKILIDDGYFQFKVISKNKDKVIARAIKGGIIGSRKGLNLPGLTVDLPTLLQSDLRYLDMASRQKIDFIALSFVRTSADIKLLRQEMQKRKLNADIIAKIENQKALDNFDEILKYSDAIMIARGDLGVEVDLHKLPFLQKQMIKKARIQSKPIITATQMLHSMVNKSLPTRAEVSDVANAVYDNTDAVMLSGETASGNHPLESVQIMKKIITFTEEKRGSSIINTNCDCLLDALVLGAYNLFKASQMLKKNPKMFLVLTETGRTARFLSGFRPEKPIAAITDRKEIRDKLFLPYGVMPFYLKYPQGKIHSLKTVFSFLVRRKVLKEGDFVVVVRGKSWGEPGKSNTISIEQI